MARSRSPWLSAITASTHLSQADPKSIPAVPGSHAYLLMYRTAAFMSPRRTAMYARIDSPTRMNPCVPISSAIVIPASASATASSRRAAASLTRARKSEGCAASTVTPRVSISSSAARMARSAASN